MADELKAMGEVQKALDDLEPDELTRVLRWAVDKYAGDVKLAGARKQLGSRGQGGGNSGEEYERISDLMDAASPSTGIDHVLVATYWFQVVQGKDDVTGQEVNSELKDLGQESSNITRSFNGLKDRRPALARQVQKSGTSQQARKRYRLTTEGIRAVERMLAGEGEDS